MTRESTTSPRQQSIAVRTAADKREREAIDGWLAGHAGVEIVEFAPKDDDDLDDALCGGRFDRVLFADLEALLATIWKGHARVDIWDAAGVRIELAQAPSASDGAGDGKDDPSWRVFVSRTYASLTLWRRRQRRRQITAAAILSALALAAMWVLFSFVPSGN